MSLRKFYSIYKNEFTREFEFIYNQQFRIRRKEDDYKLVAMWTQEKES